MGNQVSDLPDLVNIKAWYNSPDLDIWSNNSLNVRKNKLTFEDLLPYVGKVHEFLYSPQDSINDSQTHSLYIGQDIVLQTIENAPGNEYQWFFNDDTIPNATNPDLLIKDITAEQFGSYHCAVKNFALYYLTLYRRKIHLTENQNGIYVQIRADLQGVFDTSLYMMQSTLAEDKLVPCEQPFNQAPWNYEGVEEVNCEMPDNVIDWILVEVRHPLLPEIVIDQKACLLMANGNIVEPEGLEALYPQGIVFPDLLYGGDYYISVKPRNHLAVMSKKAISFPQLAPFNFSDPINVKGGANQLADLERGFYALRSGDYNADGTITIDDYIGYKNQAANINDYYQADFSLDGSVTVTDFNFMNGNFGVIGVKEVRYD